MRASPRISVLGESEDPCIVGNRPSKDYKAVISFWRWFPFHQGLLMCVSLTTVALSAKLFLQRLQLIPLDLLLREGLKKTIESVIMIKARGGGEYAGGDHIS